MKDIHNHYHFILKNIIDTFRKDNLDRTDLGSHEFRHCPFVRICVGNGYLKIDL